MVHVARCRLRGAWCVVHVECWRSRRRRTSSVDSDADSVRVRPTEKRRSPHSCKSAPPPPPPQLSCWKRTSESSGSERLSGASYGRARGRHVVTVRMEGPSHACCNMLRVASMLQLVAGCNLESRIALAFWDLAAFVAPRSPWRMVYAARCALSCWAHVER